jgi:hypothetical protein
VRLNSLSTRRPRRSLAARYDLPRRIQMPLMQAPASLRFLNSPEHLSAFFTLVLEQPRVADLKTMLTIVLYKHFTYGTVPAFENTRS